MFSFCTRLRFAVTFFFVRGAYDLRVFFFVERQAVLVGEGVLGQRFYFLVSRGYPEERFSLVLRALQLLFELLLPHFEVREVGLGRLVDLAEALHERLLEVVQVVFCGVEASETLVFFLEAVVDFLL